MEPQSISKRCKFRTTEYRNKESSISELEKDTKDLMQQLNIAKTDLSNTKNALSFMRRTSEFPILVRCNAKSKEYYLFDLGVVVKIKINGNDAMLYENAVDLTGVPSFRSLTTEKIATDIMAAFEVIDAWHKPKTWEELKDLFRKHYHIE